ncbi:MAG: hypothetical protein GY811_13895 [Myxococcales bacterium]|nr:hypothetical protein [Myxococcales bacterium]
MTNKTFAMDATGMQSGGVDWWGYVEGDELVVGLLVGITVVLAIAYLVSRIAAAPRSQKL